MEVKGKKRKAEKLGVNGKVHENGKPPTKKNKIQKEKKLIDHDYQSKKELTLKKSDKKLKKKPKQLDINQKKDNDFVTENPEFMEEDTVDVNSEAILQTNRTERRRVSGQYKPENINFNEEQLKERIQKISNQEKLSKTARRKLAVFKKKLHILQGTYVKPPPPTVSGLTKNESRKLRKKELKKKVVSMLKNEDYEKDVTEEAFHAAKTVKGSKIKSNKYSNYERFNENNENVQNVTRKLKTEKIKERPEENIENEESDENNEKSDDDNEENDEDDEGNNDEDENKVIRKNQFKQKVELSKAKPPRSLDKNNVQKKTRYVLFVGNIPFTAAVDDIKKHFLTKVSDVTSVRIPLNQKTQKPRGIAYVEFNNNIDYEKGLSLHHSQINGRRINVLYSQSGSKTVNKRPDVIAKNKKLHALRKKGKLAGSVKETQKRSVRRNKQKNKNA